MEQARSEAAGSDEVSGCERASTQERTESAVRRGVRVRLAPIPPADYFPRALGICWAPSSTSLRNPSYAKLLVFALVHQVRFGSDDLEVSFGAFGVDVTGFAV